MPRLELGWTGWLLLGFCQDDDRRRGSWGERTERRREKREGGSPEGRVELGRAGMHEVDNVKSQQESEVEQGGWRNGNCCI